MTVSRRLLLAAPFIARGVAAQEAWPTRSIRMIVAFAAGGAADTAARAVAPEIGEALGQSVIIENRTGGNAVIAANATLGAPHDGYTFLVDAANQLTNPVLMRDLPFDYERAFVPMSQICAFPQVLAVKQDFPARTLAEFIQQARARPGTISVGTPPAAGMGHLALAAFEARAGIRLVHAPYRGGADAARDIMAGSVDAVLITTSSVRAPMQTGRARGLAITSLERVATLPEMPTFAEQGFPGFDMNDWNGVFAASGTPGPIVARMAAAIGVATRAASVRARMDPAGAIMIGNTPAQFAAWMGAQRRSVAEVIRQANITLG